MEEKQLILLIFVGFYFKKVIGEGVNGTKQNLKARYYSFLCSSDILKREKQTYHGTWVVE